MNLIALIFQFIRIGELLVMGGAAIYFEFSMVRVMGLTWSPSGWAWKPWS